MSRKINFKSVWFVSIAGLSVTVLLLIEQIKLWNNLTFGDFPYINKDSLHILLYNLGSQWNEANLGHNPRFKFGIVFDLLAALFDLNYFFRILMPLWLSFVSIFFALKTVGIKKTSILYICAFFYIANPVIFGDLLSAQNLLVFSVVPWVFVSLYSIFGPDQLINKAQSKLIISVLGTILIFPPLLLPLLFTASLFALTLIIFSKPKPQSLKTYALTNIKRIVIIGSILFVLLLPFIAATSSGGGSYSDTSVNIKQIYSYNYDKSTILNALRLAGNQGNGQNYLGYNVFSLSNSVGLFGIVIILLCVAKTLPLGLKQRIIPFFIVLLLCIGFIHAISVSADFSRTFFSSGWISASLRNPGKIYIFILYFFITCFGLSLYFITNRYPRYSRFILSFSLIAISIYSWPIYGQDMGLFHNRQQDIAKFTLNKVDTDIIEYSKSAKGRSLIIPSDHIDELNIHNRSTDLNTIRTGDLLPDSNKLVKSLNESYNNQNTVFFKILDYASIKYIYIKKEPPKYTDNYSLFKSLLTPQQSEEFMALGGMSKIYENKSFILYSSKTSMPMLTTASGISTYEKPTVFNFNMLSALKDNTIVASNNEMPVVVPSNKVVTPREYDQIKAGSTIVLSDPSSTEYSFVKDTIKDTISIYSKSYFTNNSLLEQIVSVNPKDIVAIKVNNDYLNFTDQVLTTNLTIGKKKIEFIKGSPVIENSLTEATSTTKHKVIDASSTGPSASLVDWSYKKEGAESALSLISYGNLALISIPISVEPNSNYKLTFDSKNISGPSGLSSITSKNIKLDRSSGRLVKSSEYSSASLYFETGADMYTAALNLYSQGSKKLQAENDFKNIRLYKLSNVEKVSLEPKLQNGYRTLDENISLTGYDGITNHINDGSFEDQSEWGKAQDASIGVPGPSGVASRLSKDANNGEYSLELIAEKHDAYISSQMLNFKQGKSYKLQLDYKWNSGGSPSYLVLERGTGAIIKSGKLDKNNIWTTFDTVFTPSDTATGVELFLYSERSDTADKTSINFDDVSIREVSPISNVYTLTPPPKTNYDLKVITFKRNRPTEIKVALSGKEGVLLFNESYHKGWVLKSNNKLMSSEHFKSNGWANGWYIKAAGTEKTIDVTLTYTPQKTFNILMALSMIISVSLLAVAFRRTNRHE